MEQYGFIKVGACVLELNVADVNFNLNEIKKEIDIAIENNVSIITFPELALTGYTCADLFNQDILITKAYKALQELVEFSKDRKITIIVGAPIRINSSLFNTGVVINSGKILGIVPKTYIPNYNEFYEKRWFNSSIDLNIKEIELFGQNNIPIGIDLIFEDENIDELKFGIEICEDVWSVNPNSNDLALNGATIIFNLSASNETIGKYEYRKNLIKMQSSRLIAGYVYASSGVNESTSDILFSGSSMIYENGSLLKENERFNFNSNLIFADIDVKRLAHDRIKNTSFNIKGEEYRKIKFETVKNKNIDRTYSKTPFVPNNDLKREERCKEIINIQSSALAKRLKHTGIKKCVIGMSGGLDSTLAFLIIIETYKKLKI